MSEFRKYVALSCDTASSLLSVIRSRLGAGFVQTQWVWKAESMDKTV
jgi:hypothetical protein